nr:transforming acidic coiled-coil-containing protein 3 [Misgurnus anguillicaudatus]XP_055025400.1 transforming acidic coiled-coil-containing protein 3 [Misgurnus anguillicaudatus]XP_055025401.1 transforming acidic coiled-coil-containing protein 3 [Misgurnus anguillicaudatus]
MSSVAVKENQGVCAVRKNSGSEDFCDIFLLEQPTGRPSILRQSQADNINRTAPKAAKVCFQTPLRDPVTKRIMSPSRKSGNANQEDNTHILETLTDQSSLLSTSTTPVNMQSSSISLPDDDMPIQSKGAYTLDLDNLDAVNPFLGSNKMANSPPKSSDLLVTRASELTESNTATATVCDAKDDQKVLDVSDTPLDETLPFVPSVENSLAEISSVEGTVIIKTDNIEKSITDTEESDITEPAQEPQQISVVKDQPETQDSPLPPAGSYNLDFDNIDLLNPFQTGGSKIPNSPMLGKNVEVSDPPSQEVMQEPEISVQTPPVVPDAPCPSQEKSPVTEGSSSTTPPKENPMLLEFNFNDGAEVKCKPPPKRLGVKRPPGAKPITKKTEKKEPEPKKLSPKNSEETEPVEVLPVKGSYAFDFDKFDDPNFNPFGTTAKMGNSPPRGIQTSPVLKREAVPAEQTEISRHDELSEAPAHEDPEHRSPQAISESNASVDKTEVSVPMLIGNDVEAPAAIHTEIPQSPATQEPEVTATPEPKQDLLNQTCELGMATPSEDEFVPGALFMPCGDFDGQIDYLEQFGSNNFKESALRKQSLYLKFDPLLKESPKKNGMESAGFSLPRPSLAVRMMEAAKSEGKQRSQCHSAKLLDDFPPPVVDNVVPDPTVLDLLVPTLKQPVKAEESIIEVLKYSQKDMDAALQRADRQAEERQQQLNAQIERLQLENQHMLFIVSEFENTITQITDEHKQKEDLAKIELERVSLEKEQLAKDLNELERSFSSVVKRLDRCKEVIEGFKKNEDTLKQYAQNCMDRLQKEEKRYQALKAHAEEKLDHANKAIADVRTKTGAEVATLQVQLKREQLKVQSLEKDLEQKAKEVKDVTELCDELLLKVQKHGF